MGERLPIDQGNRGSPLVSVAMPIYNAGAYLRLAVLSLIAQTLTDWELILIDDGSTDDAIDSIADIQDKRIKILCDGKNKGLAARLNEAIDLARGQFLARMDQDDVSYPERFMRQVAALQADLKLDLVATRAITIDEYDNATGLFPWRLMHEEICARPWNCFYLPHPTWMGRIEWFRKFRYAQPAPYFCEDQELLLRSYRASCFATLDDILFAYRIRKKINWTKLAKTRCAVRNIQMRFFGNARQAHYLLLALAAFVVRRIGDCLLWAFPNAIKQFRPVNSEAQLTWLSLVRRLHADIKKNPHAEVIA